MNRFNLPVMGLVSAALLAGSVAVATPAAATGYHLGCAGSQYTNWFICDVYYDSTGSTITNPRCTATERPSPSGTTSPR